MNNVAGKYIIIIGILVLIIGILVYFFPGAFRWIGRLPGDIRVEKNNTGFYFPVVTMIVISIIITIIFNLIKRFF